METEGEIVDLSDTHSLIDIRGGDGTYRRPAAACALVGAGLNVGVGVG